MNLIKISDAIKKEIVHASPSIKTPYHNNIKLVFADFIASGRPSPIIEEYIREKVLPYYSNTHSNAYCGIMMKNMVSETKKYIRKTMNIDNRKKIIFTGSGTTGAVNHLVYCLKLELIGNVNIFLTPEEHHSNYLPWIELAKRNTNIHINIIQMTDNFDLDFVDLENKIKDANKDKNTVNIISLTSCSNVLGIKIDVKSVYNMLQKYNNCEDVCCYTKRNLLFVDYACSAPYVKIDGQLADAFFFSPHKFLGGVSTPGILIANMELFQSKTPYEPGGGSVTKVCSTQVNYDNDIEKKESAGTPNIVGIIKIRKVLQLKDMLFPIIEHNEHEIAKYVFCQFKKMMEKHKNLQVILPNCQVVNRLPIVCISVKDIHYNLVVALLSDLFAIQSRGGKSCTGLLSELIKKILGVDGWIRISFNYLMDQKEVDYIINAVKYILENVDKYKNQYTYDKKSNLYTNNTIKNQ